MAAIRQAKTGTVGPGTTLAITFDNPTVTGNAVVVIIRAAEEIGLSMPAHTVAGNSGDTSYTSLASAQFDSNNDVRLSAFLFQNITGRSGHAVTITPGDSAYITARTYELEGVPTSGIVTGAPSIAAAPSASSMSSGAVTPAANGLFIGASTYGHGSGSPQTITPTWSGATQEAEIDEGDATTGPLNILTKAATASTAQTATWSMNATADGVASLLVAFADGGGGGGGAIIPVIVHHLRQQGMV